ncbi:M48 family metalloprotease [Benzoatithermus flavus]|uniref:M48 family metalloprotease n=1 Tax=Benzoatithermus flavus TaxID=3108223 RepID=A0ABU8XMG5_9PROT
MRRKLFGLLLAATALVACMEVRNPATGEIQYTSMTPEDEKRIGAEENKKALAEFGGRYGDAKLQAYVERVGNRVKNASELADQNFTFTVLDSDIVNAFALPGGYVYVTRGLLALANNEAELAGVLGHEIGHVTARHTAQRYDRAQVATGGALLGTLLGAVAGAYVGGDLGQMIARGVGQGAQTLATAYVQGYSREQELEADQLGIRYLGRAGYDPAAMATFLEALEANERFEAAHGQAGAAVPDWLRSHPRTPDRIMAAVRAVSAEQPGARQENRPDFLAAIDGMIWGEDPAQGVVQGRRFAHPELRIAFEAPYGFTLKNTPAAVIGRDQRGRFMIFDMAPEPRSADLRSYLQNEWVTRQRLQDLQSLSVNGQEAAVGFGQVVVNQKPAMAMFAAVRAPDGKVYRFLYAKTAQLTRGDVDDFGASLESFRPLSAAEAATLRPLRVEIVPVRAGDTIDTFARQMDVEQDPRGIFILLNGLDRGRDLRPGDEVKILKRAPAPVAGLEPRLAPSPQTGHNAATVTGRGSGRDGAAVL